MDYSDKELLELFKTNSSYAFNLLVRKYQKQIYWHVRRIVIVHDDANDIVQNTFIKVWENLKNFREESKLYTWLYQIATNESINFLKKKRTKFFIPIIDVESELSQKLEDNNCFSGNQIQLKLQKAILKLPEKQRIIFNMRYFDELPYEKISEILGTTVGGLKASYHHAVKKIEKFVIEN
ncbi:MAG: RNA polymerase sigma factor [Bacteroidota bacterium]|nr:RNA polymerase sigma factor [Bacteroidota bacterium]